MRVLLASFFLFSSAAFVPVSADTLPTAQEIRDKSDAAAGPVPKNYRETIVGTGTAGETKDVTYQDGDDVRNTYERGAYHSEDGTYHGQRWELGNNGLVRALAPDPGKAPEEHLSETVTHVSDPFDALVITTKNVRSAGTRTYYDAKTFLVRRIEAFDSTGTAVDTYDDFEPFGSRTLAKHWTEVSPEDRFEMHYTRTEYVAGGATESDVKEASTQRLLPEFPTGVTSVQLPVEIFGGQIMVRVSIGKHTADFVLDTGSSGLFIDAAYAKSIGLTLDNPTININAGKYTSYATLVPEMHVGALTMHDLTFEVGPMPEQFTDKLKPVGLLGFDFLAQLGVTIDYPNSKVTLVPAASFTPPADPLSFDFEIRLTDAVPMLTVGVENALAERMILDTGWSGSMAFFDHFSRLNPQIFRYPVGQLLRVGVGGEVTENYYKLHDVTLGKLRFQNFAAGLLPVGAYPDESDGVIGSDILSLFTLSLDYTNGHIYFTPSPDTKGAMKAR